MNIFRINFSIFFLLSLSLFPWNVSATENSHQFGCSQDINSISGLKFQTINNDLWDLKYYYIENDSFVLNGSNFNVVLYLFWKEKYLGYNVYINNKEKSFSIKKYLFDKKDLSFKKIHNAKWLWVTNDEIIIFEKFSIHQAKVSFLCKEEYLAIDPNFEMIR